MSTQVRKPPARASSWAPESWDAMHEAIGPYIVPVARALGLSTSIVEKWRREFGPELHQNGERNPALRNVIIARAAMAAGRDPWKAIAHVRWESEQLGYRLMPTCTAEPASVLATLAAIDQATGTLSAVYALALEDGVYTLAEQRMVRQHVDSTYRALAMLEARGARAS